MSYQQIIIILKIFKNLFACKIVFDANHQYPENIQRLFRLQNCLRRKPSISWKYSKTFSPAKLSYPQIIIILKIFKNLFACKIVLAANHQYLGNIQKLFRLQNCLIRKSSLSWKYSKTCSPAKLSEPQTINILEIFKNFFACKIVFDANHQYPENIQRLFPLQNCLRRKPSISWKYSKTFSPAKLSYPQIIIILKIFKNLFAYKIVLAANHQYLGNIQKLFRLQNCLIRKSSLSWKYSKTCSPAKLSEPQTINILEIFKNFFACKIVFDANHQYPENIQRLFPLQSRLSSKSSFSWKYSKTFCLQNCLSRKSALSWKYSKTFLPANLSHPQIIIILKIFEDFFACKIVLAANHHYHGNIQRLFRLQNCHRRKSSLSWKYSRFFRQQICFSRKSAFFWKYSKTCSPAKLSYPQIIIILKIFKNLFACKIVLAANHQYLGNIQKLFRLQNCLRRKSSISWKYSKTFSPAKSS